MKLLRRAGLSVSCLLLWLGTAVGANWPAWRGPTGDGVCPETDLPLKWSATENVKWKVPLPERGNSTPIVWGNRIFVTQAVGDRRTLMCFAREDGKLLWQQGPVWSEKELTHATNPYCSSSPVTDGERVLAWFGSAGLWCWDLEGKELWHADLGQQEHIWGYGSSPVLVGDLCVLNFGPGERSFLVALDKRTGKEAWRHDVPPPAVWEGNGATQHWSGAWSTPVVHPTGAGPDLLTSSPGALRGYDPATGHERWHCDGLNPLVYADPLVAGSVLVGMGGYGGYAIGVPAGGEGDLTSHRLWQEKHNSQRLGSGVVKDGLIYMVNEPGTVQCLDPQTGRAIWQERPQVPSGRASSWSSLVLSGDRLYLVTQASDTVVLRASREYEQLSVNALEDGLTNASLAVSDGQIFIRTHQHLWCIAARP